jgi:hypothetical protein
MKERSAFEVRLVTAERLQVAQSGRPHHFSIQTSAPECI